jgi:GNAT superfamily N-acetyltransferase
MPKRNLDNLDTKAPAGYCECKLPKKKLALEIARVARDFGDGIPEEDIQEYTRPNHVNDWDTLCECKSGKVVSVARHQKNDWYMNIIKNVATDPAHRGHGLGTIVSNRAIKRANEEDGALVLSADITEDNHASQRIFEKAGFKKVNKFCFAPGFAPADVEHYVLYPVDKHGKCT